MPTTSRRPTLGALLLALALAGCDAGTGPDRNQTRILLSQGSASSASFSIAVSPDRDGDPGNGRAVIALVDSLDVTITAVQALPARYIDGPGEEHGWQTLTLAAPMTVDLFSLPSSGDGIEIGRGELTPGTYVRLRFLVSEASLRLRAPLTIGRNTFAADTSHSLRIPSPWISVPGAYFTVAEGDGGVASVVFDPAASLGQLTVGAGGQLTLNPVLRGRGPAKDE